MLDITTSYAEVGDFYRNAGDLATAVPYYQKAAEYAQQVLEAGERTSTALKTVSSSWLNLGQVHLGQGDADAAAEYFNKAVAFGQELVEH